MALLMMTRNFRWKKRIRERDKTIKTLQEEINSLKGISIAKSREVSQAVPLEPVATPGIFRGFEGLDTSSKEKKPSTLKRVVSWIKEKF